MQGTLNANTIQFKLPVPPGFLVTTPEQAKHVVSVMSKSTLQLLILPKLTSHQMHHQ